jgi:hypothetical protein
MKLEKIITLANKPVRLRLLGMERSLRATGCDLPLLVIPYDEKQFDLPPNATWWTTPLRDWLQQERTHPTMAKYQCLTVGNYQYVDSDVVFLRNPETVLANEEGFVTSCGHWHNMDQTFTTESLPFLQARTTCWPRNVFNTGQYACDRVLYTEDEIKRTCLDPRHIETTLRFRFHEQPGVNLLVNLSDVPINNLTLPPTCMESTWAGDYEQPGYERYWQDEKRKPYLIHWAGRLMWEPRAIDPLFTQYLTRDELKEWEEEVAAGQRRDALSRHSFRRRLRGVAHGVRAFTGEVGK